VISAAGRTFLLRLGWQGKRTFWIGQTAPENYPAGINNLDISKTHRPAAKRDRDEKWAGGPVERKMQVRDEEPAAHGRFADAPRVARMASTEVEARAARSAAVDFQHGQY